MRAACQEGQWLAITFELHAMHPAPLSQLPMTPARRQRGRSCAHLCDACGQQCNFSVSLLEFATTLAISKKKKKSIYNILHGTARWRRFFVLSAGQLASLHVDLVGIGSTNSKSLCNRNNSSSKGTQIRSSGMNKLGAKRILFEAIFCRAMFEIWR